MGPDRKAAYYVGLACESRDRTAVNNDAEMALTGLCHPVALLNVAASGLFFLIGRRAFVRNLRFLLAVYGLALLLMSFWLVPLLARLGYATALNWNWQRPPTDWA